MEKMSNLLQGKYFSFTNSNFVYYVEKVVYWGDDIGNFELYYSKLNSKVVYKWTTYEFNRNVNIYDN